MRASVNQYECSIATPRSNCVCTLALQDVGKVTLPSLSWANPWGGNATRARRRAIAVGVILIDPPLAGHRCRVPKTRRTESPSVLAAGAQHAAGEGAGVLAVLQHHLAADDDVVHAFGALDPTRRAGRSVVGDLVLLDADRREVEHHEVARQSLADHSAVVQAHDAGGLERVPTDRVLEREQLAIAHPLAQHV